MGGHNTSDLLEAMFEYGIDLRQKRVFLQCGIQEHENPGQNIAEMVTRGLLFLDKVKHTTPIELWINTPGGDVDDMFAIYDVMQSCQNEIATVGHGVVASAGALILAGGTKGLRYATPHCKYMVHEFQNGVCMHGTREQEVDLHQKQASELEWSVLMGRASGRKQLPGTRGNGSARAWQEFWHDKIRTEPQFWLDANGMLKHGVIDEIWPPDDDEETE